ncbi:signal transduction histidine-protein kinase/phosphatase UhpB [Vibrio hannami]|uniref:signal transduction histidine-protein kinase/phosphatase UhpB n=1 Tax=Vibrio hannami TaxID=2717094 RepID=UPI00240FFEA5|nr:signal transduction histidine-protein kinase/phosphatase UhpB [Vibrio hannami]MDG3087259.1 signal transduction histidine-protein kinase/phosphatase UhpB [Vibrio hannami]
MTKDNHFSGNRIFSSAFLFLIYTITWFCLWSISGYLVTDIHYAALLFPVGLRIAALLLTPGQFWWVILLSEFMVWLGITSSTEFVPFDLLLLLIPFATALMLKPFQFRWQQLTIYWQQLLALVGFVLANALLISFLFFMLSKPLYLGNRVLYSSVVAAITGGILLAPFFYLLHDYIMHKVWVPLSPTLVHKAVTIRPSAYLWVLTFFVIGLISETVFQEQLTTLLLIIVLLPNIFMAYKYGWQGGVLAAVMNSVLLTAARKVTGSFSSFEEMHIFITTQALIGLGLGIAISRQHLLSEKLHQLNRNLEQELHTKQQLTRQLVHVEEDIRKSVARELHDEIGQNITAIQIQATLANRTAKEEQTRHISDAINNLALKIHTSTRHLLTQLRPQILDELGLENALIHLAQEMKFKERDIDCVINIGVSTEQLDEVTTVTIYRVIQELLNNTTKYAGASEVHITLFPGSHLRLEYRDNGIGIPSDWRKKGTGLLGIEERVTALGGEFNVEDRDGTRVIVSLPAKSDSKPPN